MANAKLSDIQMKQIHDQEQKLRDHNDKVLKYLESSLPQYEKLSEVNKPELNGSL